MVPRKVVLITGCSAGGLGHALAEAFAREGCSVWASARRLGSMQALVPLGCRLLELDVTDEQQLQAAVQTMVDEEGHIDVLVNNAGVLIKGFALDVPMGAVRRLMEVNVFALMAACQLVGAHMARQRSGVVVNIGSVAGYLGLPQAAAYCCSKQAVRAFSDALRVELAPFGVRVMHVALGYTKTQIFEKDGANLFEDPHGPYGSGFERATIELRKNDLVDGPGSLAPDAPAAVAARIVRAALASRGPPAHLVTGWLAHPFRWLGCYAPLWLLDALNRLRLFGTLW